MEQTGEVPGTMRRTPAEADALVVTVLQRHADLLLRAARRGSICEDDAADAYQRGIEIFLIHAARLEAATAHSWLYRVIAHEAAAVRKQRLRLVGPICAGPDQEARHLPSPEEEVIGREALAHAGEALHALKADELRALLLQADGHSYAEIAAAAGWTFTKVNRALTEGRRRLLARRAAIDEGAECERWRPLLGALLAGGTPAREELTDARRHLRGCPACGAAIRRLHAEGAPAAGVAAA